MFAYLHLPLAYSARCFTARAENRPKDDCEFCCLNYPADIALHGQEGEALFTLNGIQALFAGVSNRLSDYDQLAASGADILRLCPRAQGIEQVIADLDVVPKGARTPLAVEAATAIGMVAPACCALRRRDCVEPCRPGLRCWRPSAAATALPAFRHAATEPGTSLNRLFAEPLGDGAFAILDGRWLQLCIPDLGQGWFVTQRNGRLHIARQATADVRISGNWRELLAGQPPGRPGYAVLPPPPGHRGRHRTGLAVKNLTDSLDPVQLPPLLWRLLQGAGQKLAELAQNEAVVSRS